QAWRAQPLGVGELPGPPVAGAVGGGPAAAGIDGYLVLDPGEPAAAYQRQGDPGGRRLRRGSGPVGCRSGPVGARGQEQQQRRGQRGQQSSVHESWTYRRRPPVPVGAGLPRRSWTRVPLAGGGRVQDLNAPPPVNAPPQVNAPPP